MININLRTTIKRTRKTFWVKFINQINLQKNQPLQLLNKMHTKTT